MDRVTRIDAEPWCRGGVAPPLRAGGAIEAEFDVDPAAWYFAADRQDAMPYVILLEAALQPCGWLAAYLGPAFTSPDDLCFRNLGGTARLHAPVGRGAGVLSTRVRVTSLSRLLPAHDPDASSVRHGNAHARADKIIYEGSTNFGFFSREALARQVGIQGASLHEMSAAERAAARAFDYPTRSCRSL